MPFASTNPATGRLIRRYRLHRPNEVDEIVAHLARAQHAWREVAPRERARHLRALERQLLRDRDDLAATITTEMGKPLLEARQEVEKCASACRFYAEHGPAGLRPENRPGAPDGAEVLFAPLGVVLAIMPWNFPFWQAFRALAPALIAGNTLLLKHAPNVTGCAEAIEQVLLAAGLPAGLLRMVRIEPATVARLIKDPRIRAVTLTGSTRAGRQVAALAGAALKPCVLELGGSDPYLVLGDADLDRAVRTVTNGRLLNAGQSCISAKRLIVVEAVRQEFEERLIEAFRARRWGDPMDPAVNMGPLARADLRATLHRQVTRTVRAGAQLRLGGRLPKGPGFFYPPTVLTAVEPSMAAAREELFGPIAVVMPVPDEEAGIALANDSRFGLGAGVFTRRRAHGLALARDRLEAGSVFVNDFVRSDPSLPFGGIRDSGFGRELGLEGLRSFVNVKTVVATK